MPVTGVTTGQLQPGLAGLAVPDTTGGTVPLTYGSYGSRGGQRDGQDVLWSPGQGWRNVPQDVWGYLACGFPVLPKWLSYRVTNGLRPTDRQEFMLLARRVAALLAVQPDCDAAYAAAVDAPLEQPTLDPG